MTAPIPARPPATNSGQLWWWLPRVSILLFVAGIFALFWYLERSDREEKRTALISDMLWLEQNLRFVLHHNEDLLGRFDPQRIGQRETFQAHAAPVIASNSGVIQVRWLAPSGEQLDAYPPVSDDPLASSSAADMAAQRLAVSVAHAVYGPPYPVGNDWQFEVYVPIFHAGELAGIVVGVYSIRRLLADGVPWWIAERYQIAIADPSGQSLGQRSNITEIETDNAYQMPFDPPGHGLILHATSYRSATPMTGRVIMAGLAFLAALVLFSLWTLRRHVQGRLAAESALQNEVAFRKAMEDSVQTGLRARNLDGMITYVNPAFCRMVGWSPEELIGRLPPMPYWAEEYLDETRAMHAKVLAGQAPSNGFEIKLKRRNGEIFDALIIEAPLIDSQGRHTGWMGSVVDITERKRIAELARQQEERLQASARLITMGEMASSLAHELNQPLAAISSYATGCRNLIAAGAPQSEIDAAIAKCQEQAQRAGRIIRRIYEFVRRQEPKSEPCDIGLLLADLITLLDSDARRQRVRIQRDIAPNLPLLQADRILLGQALLNLMKNGIEAMGQTDEAARVLTVRAAQLADQVLISVIDRGCGIGPDTVSQLFEPFYTTKQEGLGVGLKICRSVVEAHHGRLWFEANPEGGTIFHIALPCNSQ
ncbi:sensor histidine kinase [Sulfuricystis thermophila]|uniref:sensor histidine kinase n=1 Tax=Sulfuricystis thermophila TaxID=2496847 RepID=UPI00103649AD|nr:PAS domain S-box protein [Sulfuricystis thermophila]